MVDKTLNIALITISYSQSLHDGRVWNIGATIRSYQGNKFVFLQKEFESRGQTFLVNVLSVIVVIVYKHAAV